MSDASLSAQHERPGLNTRGVVIAIIGLFSLVVLALVVVGGLLDLSFGRVAIPEAAAPTFPAPGLQLDPQQDLNEVQSRDRMRLNEQAAMPIDQAAKLIVQRGPDAYAPLIRPAAPVEQPP